MERFGDFILLEKVASGGMADIYKAVKVGARGFYKLLAVKRIKIHICQDKAFQDMFVKEARVLSNLSHPNIASIYDLNRFNDQFYIVMEYIQGRDLHALIREQRMGGGTIPLEIVLYIMTSLAEGLEYIHNITDAEGTPLNIVHRDINPKNIFLSFQGEVKIIDFGVARADLDSEETKTGVIKGKLSYLSPEQLEGRGINGQTDIFAAGLVFYEMLSGHKLFRGKSEAELLNTVMTLDIKEKIHELQTEGGLKAILEKSLARDMAERYASAGEMKEAILAWELENGIQVSGQDLKKLMEAGFREDIEREEAGNREHFTVLRKLAEEDELDDEKTVLLDSDETVLLSEEMLRGDGTASGSPGQADDHTLLLQEKKQQDGRPTAVHGGAVQVEGRWKKFLRPPLVYGVAAGVLLVLAIVVFALSGGNRHDDRLPPASGTEQTSGEAAVSAPVEKRQAVPDETPDRNSGKTEAGYMVFDGEPAGQQIYVDGELRGVIPATVELPAGFHEIECVRAGFMPYKAGIRLRDGKVVNIRCDLKKK